jgi:hypothetical protein
MYPPVGRAHRYVHMCRKGTRTRRTGFSHRVGAPTGPSLGAPALRLPRPDALSPHPAGRASACACTRSHNTRRYSTLSVVGLAYRGGAMLALFVKSVTIKDTNLRRGVSL